jgi:hypothetical protein
MEAFARARTRLPTPPKPPADEVGVEEGIDPQIDEAGIVGTAGVDGDGMDEVGADEAEIDENIVSE